MLLFSLDEKSNQKIKAQLCCSSHFPGRPRCCAGPALNIELNFCDVSATLERRLVRRSVFWLV